MSRRAETGAADHSWHYESTKNAYTGTESFRDNARIWHKRNDSMLLSTHYENSEYRFRHLTLITIGTWVPGLWWKFSFCFTRNSLNGACNGGPTPGMYLSGKHQITLIHQKPSRAYTTRTTHTGLKRRNVLSFERHIVIPENFTDLVSITIFCICNELERQQRFAIPEIKFRNGICNGAKGGTLGQLSRRR